MRHTVLVADDDEAIRDLLVMVLAEAGYATLDAANGQAAAELALEHRPDLALLDVMMPGMDGFAACRAIKADPRTAGIPVLLLTALAHTDSKVRGLSDGATDYITKPFENAELLARIKKVLQEKDQRDALAAEALTDALTGLTNRRSLERQLDQLLAHAERGDEPLSVLLFDVDRFKVINDTYGHAAGDVVLTTLARRAQEAVRAQDVVGRLGGEEFLVILPGAGRTAAYITAERLRAHVAARPIATAAGPIDVTVSVGASTTHPGMDIERTTLITSSDHALYSAKNTGRNRVVHADGQPTTPLVMPEAPEAARALIAALTLVNAPAAEQAREVATLCWTIGGALQLAPDERARVALAGLLHNIDMLVAPQPILVTAGAFGTGEERTQDERRARGQAVAELLRDLPSLHPAVELVRAHDERWDGSGNPAEPRGDEIPLGSRVIAGAVAYGRAMRGGASTRDAAATLRDAAGSRLDPLVVAAALRVLP